MSPNFIKLFFFKIICTFLLSQSKVSVCEFHQIIIFFQIICTFLLSQSKVSVSEFHQVIFQIICTFLLSQSKVSVSEFHQIISFQIICTFLLSLWKVIVSEFQRFFFNFYQVSPRQSKPSVPQFLNSSLSLIPPKMTDSIQLQFRTSRRRRHSVVKTWPQDWQTKNFHYSTISVLNIALC